MKRTEIFGDNGEGSFLRKAVSIPGPFWHEIGGWYDKVPIL